MHQKIFNLYFNSNLHTMIQGEDMRVEDVYFLFSLSHLSLCKKAEYATLKIKI